MNQGQLAAYEEIGIEKYQFVAALSERTCDICGNLDDETFDVAAAIEGDNYSPMHANCRCTTVMAGAVPETRIARNPETRETYKVDGDISFNEWKNSLSDEQKAALKYVDKSAESGIMKENRNNKPITMITKNAIENVPFVYIPGYSEDDCYYIQGQHKELLRYSQVNNKSKETAIILEEGLETRHFVTGTEDSINFRNYLIGSRDIFIIHNHPRNQSYSTTDLEFFANTENVKTLTIVKNNGAVEYLTKGIDYDAQTFRVEYRRMYKRIVKGNTDEEKDKFIKQFLKKTKSGVMWGGQK